MNGSYIDVPAYPQGSRAFIAASAPLMKTVEDWWNMIFTNKVKLIIMLADAEEERITPVCAFYWSEDTFKVEGLVTI